MYSCIGFLRKMAYPYQSDVDTQIHICAVSYHAKVVKLACPKISKFLIKREFRVIKDGILNICEKNS